MNTRIAVIGCGEVGRLLAGFLSRDGSYDHVYCLDIRRPKNFIFPKDTSFHSVDVSRRSVLRTFLNKHRIHLVINAAAASFNRSLLRDCLVTRSCYMDLASYWDVAAKTIPGRSPYIIEQLEYHTAFRDAGIFGLINAGVSPGLTNLVVADLTADISKPHVSIRLVEDTGSDSVAFSWSKAMLIDEINWKPLVYHDGLFEVRESFSDPEQFEYPHPWGAREARLLSQEEVGSLPCYLDLSSLDLKVYDNHMSVFQTLAKLDLVSERPIAIRGRMISPAEFLIAALPDIPNFSDKPEFFNAQFAFVVSVRSPKGISKRIAAVFPKQKDINRICPGGNYITYPTALSAYLFIKHAFDGSFSGICPPEGVSPRVRSLILDELRRARIVFEY